MDKNNFRRGKILNTKEAAEYLSIVSHRTLEKWRTESIPKGPKWVKFEGKIGYPLCYLDDYIEKCSEEQGDKFAA